MVTRHRTLFLKRLFRYIFVNVKYFSVLKKNKALRYMVVVVLSTLNFFIYLFGTKETLQLERSTPQAEKLEGELNKAVRFFS